MASAIRLIAALTVPLVTVSGCELLNEGAVQPQAKSASPAPSPSPTVTPYPHVNRPCKGKIPQPFAGIATNGSFASSVASFEHDTGAHLRLVEFYNRFPGPFQSDEAQQIVNLGALPLIQLNPRQISMVQLAAGSYDSYIRSYAREVRTFGCHVVLSFGHEMNGWCIHGGDRAQRLGRSRRPGGISSASSQLSMSGT